MIPGYNRMTVRNKTILAICLAMLGLLTLFYSSARLILLQSYSTLEAQVMRENVLRARDAINNELAVLRSKLTDYAQWDDTCDFIVTRNPRYIASNFPDNTFDGLRINTVMMLARNRRVVFERSHDLTSGTAAPMPKGLRRYLNGHPELITRAMTRAGMQGVLLLDEQPMLFAALPILPNDGSGAARGTVLFGRYLDTSKVRKLEDATHLTITVHRLDTPPANPVVRDAAAKLRDSATTVTEVLSTETLAGFALLHDVSGVPALLIEVDSPRDIYAQGRTALVYLLIALTIIVFVLGIVVLIIMERLVLARLARLTSAITEIAAGGNTTDRVAIEGHDEFHTVAEAVNGVLDTVEHSQEELERRERLHRNLVELSPDAVFLIRDEVCVFANEAAARLMGAPTVETLLGMTVQQMIHTESQTFLQHFLRQLQERTEMPRTEEKMTRLDGSITDVEFSATHFTLQDRPAVQIIARDITERKRVEETLQFLAHHDTLTKLPNRLLFHDRLTQALAHARRTEQGVAVMLLDLDRFKDVNDSLGHDVGDHLLREVARRLQAATRDCDTVARISGDEFVLILPDISHVKQAEAAANRILDGFASTFIIDGHELYVTPSIGITQFPDDGESVEVLMKNADLAMYRAKSLGRNTFRFYSPGMGAALSERRTLESHLRKAIEREELLVHYQPQVQVSSGHFIGMEALVRWHHPEWGIVPPAQFIPLAEDLGLIGPIDEWVLRTACAQAVAWQDAGLPHLRATVNLSAHHFVQTDLVGMTLRILQETGLPPHMLELEISESTLVQNLERTLTTLRRLHDAGVRLSIDDFGTGYSSLGYLRRLPIHTLKIDRSFTRDMLNHPDDEAIVSAIIAMAHSLHREVIAEGVETFEQLELLHSLHCDIVQGYLFSKPVTADDFVRHVLHVEMPVVK
jgi:diguanylate cyclase (GGDEF)-like protein/PAS domain S-box-containing protein